MTPTDHSPAPSQESLQGLQPPEEYRQSRASIFQSDTSLDWIIRQHKHEFINAGALLYIAGRRMIDPPRFDAVTRDIGQRAAKQRAAA